MWSKQLNKVPLRALPAVLHDELATRGHSGIMAQAREWFFGKQDAKPRKLYALIDKARLPESDRQNIASKLKSFTVLPLLDEPKYAHLKEHCAMLVSHPSGSAGSLLHEFGLYNSNIISAWIVSKLEAQELAFHLRLAAFAYGSDNTRYVLRWYDPLTTPVLFRLGDSVWTKWFLSVVAAWWYPVDDHKGEAWNRVKGGELAISHPPEKPLMISEELWDALSNDPLPYRILSVAEENIPSAFKSGCYGVRLAKVEGMLDTAKQQGLSNQGDLMTYVLSLLAVPTLTQEKRWQTAMQQAASGQTPLKSYFVT